jgi:hypothetical protein
VVQRSRSDISKTKLDLLKTFRYSKSIYWVVRRATDVEDNIKGSVRRDNTDVSNLCPDMPRFQRQVIKGLWVE